MKAPVHILVTVRKPSLLPMAGLVFRTLRTGFPTAPVFVWGNGLDVTTAEKLAHWSAARGATFTNLVPLHHDAWIEQLVLAADAPLWICDADMVFFDNCERWQGGPDDFMVGRHEPAWREPWTRTERVERLHTCLLWMNAPAMRAALHRWALDRIKEGFPGEPQLPFIRQHIMPRLGREPLFYDSCAGAYQALGGRACTKEQNRCFAHLNCGTYAEHVAKCPELQDLPAMHAAVLANPGMAGELLERQEEFYRRHSPSRRSPCQEKGK